jgi:membrane associated rhomboid family serine protease
MTASIIAVNVVVFFLELSNGDVFVERWSLIPRDLSAGHHIFNVITAMFMHGSWSHIIGNMVFLWAFGPEMEEAMGRARFLGFYFLGGIVAFIAQVAADPGSTIPTLGASGAIATVMGGFMVTYPRDRIRTLLFLGWFVRVTLVPAALLIGFWFLIQLFSLGTITDQRAGGVAYVAHVAGLIFGVLTARIFEGTLTFSE